MRDSSVSLGFLSDSPQTLQMMRPFLGEKNYLGVKNYLDDIIVYGNSKESHDKLLNTVLQRLSEVGLEININKIDSVEKAFWVMKRWSVPVSLCPF